MDRIKALEDVKTICARYGAEVSDASELAREILHLFDPDNDPERTAGVAAMYTGKIEGLELERPVVFLDLETDSAETDTAKIIEVAGAKMLPGGGDPVWFRSLVNPGGLVSTEIEELTGITNADLVTAPPWHRVGPAFFDFLAGCDVAGYGIHNFDRIVLWNEFFRIGKLWAVESIVALDLANLAKMENPRTLGAMLEAYTQQEHEGAHRAVADTRAAIELASAMVQRHESFRGRFHDLALASAMDRRLDLAGKIIADPNGIPTYGIGDLKGKPIAEYPEFARWMLGKPFSENTKGILRAILATVPEPQRGHGKRR